MRFIILMIILLSGSFSFVFAQEKSGNKEVDWIEQKKKVVVDGNDKRIFGKKLKANQYEFKLVSFKAVGHHSVVGKFKFKHTAPKPIGLSGFGFVSPDGKDDLKSSYIPSKEFKVRFEQFKHLENDKWSDLKVLSCGFYSQEFIIQPNVELEINIGLYRFEESKGSKGKVVISGSNGELESSEFELPEIVKLLNRKRVIPKIDKIKIPQIDEKRDAQFIKKDNTGKIRVDYEAMYKSALALKDAKKAAEKFPLLTIDRKVLDSIEVAFSHRPDRVYPSENGDDYILRIVELSPSSMAIDYDLRHVSHLKNLVKLSLGSSQITDKTLEEVGQLPSLVNLSLARTQITDEGVKSLRSLDSLKRLELERTNITDKSFDVFSELSGLEKLFLSNTKITGIGLKKLVSLKKLGVLYLGGTNIEDECLKEVSLLKSIKKLYLHETKITDKNISEILKLKKLTHLWLEDTAITDKSAEVLKGIKKLEYLTLNNTKMTKKGVASLKLLIPECDVRH